MPPYSGVESERSSVQLPFIFSDVIEPHANRPELYEGKFNNHADSAFDHVDLPDESDSDFDEDQELGKAKKAKTAPLPRFKAQVQELAVVKGFKEIDTSHDDKVLQTILKCKARADHNHTPLPEVESALRMASRLQMKHNITNADLQRMAPEIKKQVCGQSIVHILPVKSGSKVVEESWVSVMADAIRMFFDCDCYSESRWDHTQVTWTFFGYAANTRLAAEAFEVVHNQTLEWARDKKRGRNSYCLGIANGLVDAAEEEKEQQEEEFKQRQREALLARRREEKLARDRELSRLHGLQIDFDAQKTQQEGSEARPLSLSSNQPRTNPRIDDIIDDDDANGRAIKTEEGMENTDSDEDEMMRKEERKRRLRAFIDTETPIETATGLLASPSPEPKSELLSGSHNTLAVYRQDAKTAAEEYLKEERIKLSKGRRLRYSIRDQIAWEQGQDDSKNIDVKRKRIDNVPREDQGFDAKLKRMKF